MRIDNLTSYSTLDLRRIFTAVCREDSFKIPEGALVRLVYAKTARISGWAAYGARNSHFDINRKRTSEKTRLHGCAMLLRVPRKDLNMERFIGVVRHEVGHWRGLKHSQMGGSLHHSWLFKLEDHPWAQSLSLSQDTEPKTVPMTDRVAAREAHARKMLTLHESKLAREKKLVNKWRTKVRYYDKKAEPHMQAAYPMKPGGHEKET